MRSAEDESAITSQHTSPVHMHHRESAFSIMLSCPGRAQGNAHLLAYKLIVQTSQRRREACIRLVNTSREHRTEQFHRFGLLTKSLPSLFNWTTSALHMRACSCIDSVQICNLIKSSQCCTSGEIAGNSQSSHALHTQLSYAWFDPVIAF